MRLTCPNCDAQYEVPDDVVPVEGRDVQCSNCGQTWYQHHPDHIPEPAVEDHEPTPDEEQPAPQEPQDPEPEEQPRRKELDPAIADILQEEAQAEQAARRAEKGDPLESQPDLGLDDNAEAVSETERRTQEARRRMARMRGEPEPMSDDDVNAAAVSSRKDLLPDIDEINSTLRTENDKAPGAEGQAQIDGPTEVRRKRGFRRGFVWILLLIAIAVLVYVYAPQISAAVPALENTLTAYVAWVDQMRLWLDGQVQNGLRWLDSVASQFGSAGSDG